MRTRALLAGALALILALPVFAASRHDEPGPAFAPVPVHGEPSPEPHPGVTAAVIVDRLDVPPVRPTARPVVAVPEPRVRAERRDPAPAVGGQAGSRRSTRGVASWYCGHGSACTRGYPGGLYAAAGPALRVGTWRGRAVQVEAGGRRVLVRLVDWCACPNGRLLDLYSDAFSRLAPLSRGLVKVSVSW